MTDIVISEDAKWYAIGQYLSDWPDGLTADQVIGEVELNTDDVTIWEPFEDYDGSNIAEWITSLAEEFDQFRRAKPTPTQSEFRWYLGYIFTREGEREHKQTAVLKLKPNDDVKLCADHLAAAWWGGKLEKSGDGYYCFGGEIYVEAGEFIEITEEVAITITQYPMHINWFAPEYETDTTTKEGEHAS